MNSAVLAEKTRLAAPLGELEARVVAEFPKVEGWLRAQFWRTPPPFYCSVDLRNDGRKIAPIDTNLFPGGFNNLPRESHPVAMEAFRRLLADLCPNAKSVLLVPENHTRNLVYWDSVAVLKYLLESAGIAVRIGGLEENGQARITEGGGGMQIESVSRVGDELHIGDFRPCAILLNNDLSAGVPKMLAGLSQPTMPAVAAGWTTRRKSGHFAEYNKVADEFADELKIDPWFIRPQFAVCREVDFRRSQGLECVVKAADKVLEGIRAKHREYGIEDTPFVVVKADAGTYGMGVMTAKSADDLRSLNRRQRNKMSVIKEGLAVRDILIQEGIRAADSAAGATAEPVAYMLGGTVIGGFYRVNENRASDENLNSGGMSFMPLPFETACCPPSPFALGGGVNQLIMEMRFRAPPIDCMFTASLRDWPHSPPPANFLRTKRRRIKIKSFRLTRSGLIFGMGVLSSDFLPDWRIKMATAKFSPKIRAAKKSSTRARKKASADGSEFLLMECYTDKRLREFEEAARKLSERTRAKLYGWS